MTASGGADYPPTGPLPVANVSITVNGQTTTAFGGERGQFTAGFEAKYSGYVDGGGFGGLTQSANFPQTDFNEGGCSGGGGAGGYTGPGGQAGGGTGSFAAGYQVPDPTAGQGGGGGGGQRSSGYIYPLAVAGGGGGVGLYGLGANGNVNYSYPAGAGGGGGSGGNSGNGVYGGSYGGGAGGIKLALNESQRRGARGAIRIVWGYNRLFPSTNVSDNTTGYDTFMD
jgi:hypothetical protein